MARYDYILFDADNTLFDFDLAERRALRSVLTARGVSVTPALVERYHVINSGFWNRYDRGEITQRRLLVERFSVLLKELGSEADPVRLNLDYLQRLASCGILFPGAEALCRTLAKHCRMVIITNGATVAQRGRFEPSPIRPLFSRLFISEEIGAQKPQKEFFDIVCRETGIADRSRAVVVGDNLRTDILGGIRAGMDTVWYNPRGLKAEPDVVPTWNADSFAAVERIILPESPSP